MDILIVSATTLELPMLAGFLEAQRNKGKTNFDWLVGGVGQVATTYALMAYLKNRRPDVIIQAGIGGSFTKEYPPGTVVIVNEEVFADLGAVEAGKLVNLFDMNLAAPNEKPFISGGLRNEADLPQVKHTLKKVKGATINMMSSTNADAERIKLKYDAAVESMEGAALHYVCLKENIPFLQLRAISNFAGERNKSNWRMKEAIEALNAELTKILSSFNG